ncbi:hypothetical protein D1643_09185 [Enterorhabdus sp. P55]|nr:hypothetical protein [Enterorhabdus sp. P55]
MVNRRPTHGAQPHLIIVDLAMRLRDRESAPPPAAARKGLSDSLSRAFSICAAVIPRLFALPGRLARQLGSSRGAPARAELPGGCGL